MCLALHCVTLLREALVYFCNSVNLEQKNVCKTHECNREERMPSSINHDIANMANTANMENTVNMANLYFLELIINSIFIGINFN